MIYLLSWRGRGFVAFLAIFVAAGFMLAGSAMFGEDAALLSFAIGWMVAGIGCIILGWRWTKIADVHRFCMLRVQTWGIIYALIGLFFLRVGWLGLEQSRPHRHPIPALKPDR